MPVYERPPDVGNAFAREPLDSTKSCAAVALDDLRLHPLRQIAVHLGEAIGEQIHALLVSFAHDHDVGDRPEQHQPQRKGEAEPRHTELPGLEHDHILRGHNLAERIPLRRPHLERYPVADRGVVNPHVFLGEVHRTQPAPGQLLLNLVLIHA